MCRGKPEPLPPLKENSSLRSSSLLRAETRMYYGRGRVILFDNCKECGAAFTDAEKDKHLNHSSSTEWAGTISVEEPICQKCREANPEYGFVGRCAYCKCDGCTKKVPREHCGKGTILDLGYDGRFTSGCRRHKEGTTLPTPHRHGDVGWRDPCQCADCKRKRE